MLLVFATSTLPVSLAEPCDPDNDGGYSGLSVVIYRDGAFTQYLAPW
jgi:hypothetical protein